MPTDAGQRASPDALLALARKEGRGHLKIFLGAAPGVGKTYAMLASARSDKADGRDVVAGLVETHGRRETEQLLESRSSTATRSCMSSISTRRSSDGRACCLLTSMPTPMCLVAAIPSGGRILTNCSQQESTSGPRLTFNTSKA